MKGSFHIKVSRKRGTVFEFDVRRNITVIRGDSGTGKTTLYNMVVDHMRMGDRSGVSIQCDRPCVALTDTDWKHQIEALIDSIIFVDEGFEDILSHDFSKEVKQSSNYFVIFCRAELSSLPYSVNEVYRIKTSGKKYHSLAPIYKELDRFRFSPVLHRNFDVLLTEDSKSGLQFYTSRFKGSSVRCETSGGNASIVQWLLDHADDHVFVVADGAAFGPYIDRLFKLRASSPGKFVICLPESFEWLLLKSGIVHSADLEDMLENPGAQIESKTYASWERFFVKYLSNLTTGTPLAYDKKNLAEGYKAQPNADKVMALIACRNVK